MDDRYAPPRPKAKRSGRHVQEGMAKNRTYLILLATCLLVSILMNWVAISATGKEGRAGHIEAYLRTFLMSTKQGSTIGNEDGDGDGRAGSVRGTKGDVQDDLTFSPDDVGDEESDTENDGDYDDQRNMDEDEEDDEDEGDDDDINEATDGGEKTKTNTDGEESGMARPVELGGPPPDEASDEQEAADSNNGDIRRVVEQDRQEEDIRRPIEEGGPPPIDGRGSADVNHTEHNISGLSCAKYGGPSDRIAEFMVYWQHIPSDAEFVSPLKGVGPPKYMTFEPDGGGWNNIRMAAETVVALAHAMGRTLVLPPEQRLYLIGEDENKQKSHFGFADFYHMESLSREHEGFDVITMKVFLEREALFGRMVNRISGQPSFPPGNRTDWNGENAQGIKVLNEWLRTVTLIPQWKPDECMVAFPASRGEGASKSLEEAYQQIKEMGRPLGTGAVPVDAPIVQRMHEVANGRSLCLYDEKMQEDAFIHFVSSHKMGLRLLVHFYVFLFFEDYRWDTWTKRFVRDHLRYVDEIQCAAARVAHAVRERARARRTSTNTTVFDSMHIRRGDLQYEEVKVDAVELYEASKKELIEGGTVYVATDEKNRDFFKPLEEHYDLCFLDDFKHLFEGLNTNMYGMLDQLVASRGRVFYGTYLSTFTGFINRMRGYHADKAKLHGYQNGTIQSYHFVPAERRYDMARFMPPSPPFWTREFPLAWRDIDKGIGDLPTVSLKKKLSQTPVIF